MNAIDKNNRPGYYINNTALRQYFSLYVMFVVARTVYMEYHGVLYTTSSVVCQKRGVSTKMQSKTGLILVFWP